MVIGQGKRLFAEGAVPSGLTLADSRSSTTGVAINVYRPAGPLKTGSFALGNPSDAEIERRAKLV